jgi:hypothetical protein
LRSVDVPDRRRTVVRQDGVSQGSCRGVGITGGLFNAGLLETDRGSDEVRIEVFDIGIDAVRYERLCHETDVRVVPLYEQLGEFHDTGDVHA